MQELTGSATRQTAPSREAPLVHLAVAMALGLGVGVLDVLRPGGQSFSILYLLPVAYSAWNLPGRLLLGFNALLLGVVVAAPLLSTPESGGANRLLSRTKGIAVSSLVCYLIADRRRMTRVLERANAELEERVAARTAELDQANRQLSGEIACRQHAELVQDQLFQNYRRLFDHALEGVFQTTPAGKYVTANPALAEMLGYDSPEELIASIDDVARQVYAVPAERADVLRRLHVDGFLRGLETEVVRKDGTHIWVLQNVRTVRDESGEIAYFEGFLQDVTERKRTEAALRRSEQQYARLVNNLDGIVWEAELGTFRFAFVSQQAERILGYPLACWTADTTFWIEHLHPDDREAAVQHCLESTRRGESHAFEYRMLAADGRVVWLRDFVTVVIEEGRVASVCGVMVDVTALKEAEAERRASEERFRTIFETVPECVKVLSAEGTLLEMNRSGLAMAEAESLEQLRGQGLSGLLPATDRLAFASMLPRVMAGETAEMSFEIVGLRGTRREVELTAKPLRDSDDKVVAVLGVTRDVTASRRADRALRESEARFRQFAEHVPYVVWMTSANGRQVHYVNPAYETLTGRSTDSLLAQPEAWLDAVHPEDRPRVVETALRQMRQNSSQEFRIVHADGTIRWVHDVVVTVRNDLGEPYLCVGIAKDITDAKLAELALRETEQRFRQFAEHIPYIIWMTTPDGRRILYINPAYETITGRTCHSLYESPESWLEMLHPDDRPRIVEKFLSPAYQNYTEEFRIVRPDGTIRWIHYVVVTITNELGEPTLCVGVAKDITDSKLAEQRLAEHQSEVWHAARLNTMGQMTATISHELAQPLAVIGNFAAACTMLLNTPERSSQELLPHLAEIERQSSRAAAILHRLRDFTRHTTLHREACQLNDLARDSGDLVRSDLVRRGIQLAWDLDPQLPPIVGDRVQLQQVFVNLFTNAADALEEAGDVGKVILIRSRRMNGDALVDIVDGGAGIPDKLFDRLFQPFVTTKPNGMGIGLSICRAILREHLGEIDARNNPDGGATFTIQMPVADAA